MWRSTPRRPGTSSSRSRRRRFRWSPRCSSAHAKSTKRSRTCRSCSTPRASTSSGVTCSSIACSPATPTSQRTCAWCATWPRATPRSRRRISRSRRPHDPDLLYTIGILAFQGKDYALAEDNMKRLLALPDYRDPDAARFFLGQIAEEQKQWPRALEWYEAIQDGEQALPARLRAANAIAKQGKLDAAREYLHKTAEDHPGQEVQFTVAEAQLLRDANRAQDAYRLLGEALKSEPDQPE